MAAAVTRLLRERELAAELGQAGRTRVEQVFSWRNHVDGYDALYKKLTKQSVGRHVTNRITEPREISE